MDPLGPSDPYGPQDVQPGQAYDPHYGSGPQDAVSPQPMGESQRSGGFGGFPFPHYSTRTRRGTQVTVGGCCLPIPIGCLTACVAAAVVGAAQLKRRLDG